MEDMRIPDVVDRLQTIRAALRRGPEELAKGQLPFMPKFRPHKDFDWKIAAIMMRFPGTPTELAGQVYQRQVEINELSRELVQRRSWLARRPWLIDALTYFPKRSDWTETAITLGCEVDMEYYRRLRHSVFDKVLFLPDLAAAGVPIDQAAHAAELLKQLVKKAAPKSIPERREAYLITHAARHMTTEDVQRLQEQARLVLKERKSPSKVRKLAPFYCVAFETDPGEIHQRFEELHATRKSTKHLRKLDDALLIEWAAQGITRDDLAGIGSLHARLRKLTRFGRREDYRLARLVQLSQQRPLNHNVLFQAVLAESFTPRAGSDGGGDAGGP